MGYHVRVKVCGVTTASDARAVALAGADAVGLNFYPDSPRFLAGERANAVAAALPPYVEAVGVFVGVPLEETGACVGAAGRVTTIQMHGTSHEVAGASRWRLIPAFAVRGPRDLEGIDRYLQACADAGCLPDAVLVDGHAAGLHGGTGVKAPWDLLGEYTCRVPLILAGGLSPENVAEAVRRVRPYAVDVASGVERSPGVKDLDRVRAFIDRAREAAVSV